MKNNNLFKFSLVLILIGTHSFVFAQNNDKVKTIHKKVIKVDSHIDIRPDFNTAGNDASKETLDQIDLPKLEKGGLDVATIALFADLDKPSPENNKLAAKLVQSKLEAIKKWVKANPNKLEIAKSVKDIERIKNEGKHAILLSFLNAFWFNSNINLIDSFYNKGVRVFGFDHAGNTEFAGSSRPNEAYKDQPNVGLSKLGEEGVKRLNKLGVLIDVSQLSTTALFKVLEISKSPVVASHSAVKSIVDVTRNLSDAELKAIAKQGGVVQIVAFAGYIKKDTSFKTAYLNAVSKPFGIVPLKDDPKTSLTPEKYKEYKAAYLNFSRNEWVVC